MDDLTAIRRARDLISDPVRWTQGKYARNASGLPVAPGSKYATCWCALGAVRKVTRATFAFLPLTFKLSPDCTVASFNDEHTHAEVLAMFDAAIERESAR